VLRGSDADAGLLRAEILAELFALEPIASESADVLVEEAPALETPSEKARA
jgi:hypothetical protein